MGPQYKHNCNGCVFIEQSEATGRVIDWYHCPRCDGGTIVGRASDEPSDYWSMPVGVIKSAVENKANASLGLYIPKAYELMKGLKDGQGNTKTNMA